MDISPDEFDYQENAELAADAGDPERPIDDAVFDSEAEDLEAQPQPEPLPNLFAEDPTQVLVFASSTLIFSFNGGTLPSRGGPGTRLS